MNEQVLNWCKENITNYNTWQGFTKAYIAHFHCKISVDWLRKKLSPFRLSVKDNNGVKRLKENIQWVIDNYNNYDKLTELHAAYVKRFGRIKIATFNFWLPKLGVEPKKAPHTNYTEEQKNWLIQNVNNYYNRKPLIKAFNNEFGLEVKEAAFNNLFSRLKLKLAKKVKEVKKVKDNIYTEEENTWACDNALNYDSWVPFTKDFNKLFGHNKAVDTFSKHCRIIGISINATKKIAPPVFIKEDPETEWLLENYSKYTALQIYDAYMCAFPNSSKTRKQILNFIHNRGLKFKPEVFYTEEELNWLKENYVKAYTIHELAKMFEQEFGKQIKPNTLKSYCNSKLGLTKSKETKNEIIHKKWLEAYPIGTECKQGDFIYVKVGDKLTSRKNRKNGSENWQEKSKYIWEQKYGKIPAGKYVIHLDGNYMNFDLDNLYLCDKKMISILQFSNCYRKADFTKKAIEFFELKEEIEATINR